jgi:hypothetical protein
MLTQSQRGALSRWFDLLDADGNGVIEANDYDVMARRVCQSFAYGVDTERYERVQRIYLNLWFLLSGGADGGIDRERFVTWYAEYLVGLPDGYDGVMAPVVDAVFEMVDANGDGRVDLDEFSRLFEAYGIEPAEAARVFADVDRDRDGYVSRHELHAAAHQLYEDAGGAPSGPPPYPATHPRRHRQASPAWQRPALLAAGLVVAVVVLRRLTSR